MRLQFTVTDYKSKHFSNGARRDIFPPYVARDLFWVGDLWSKGSLICRTYVVDHFFCRTNILSTIFFVEQIFCPTHSLKRMTSWSCCPSRDYIFGIFASFLLLIMMLLLLVQNSDESLIKVRNEISYWVMIWVVNQISLNRGRSNSKGQIRKNR